MAKDRDAIVIGAGVIGSAVAYFFQEAGLSVCLIDRGAVAAGTTSASAGHTSVQGRVPGPALDLALANVRLLGELKRALPDDFEYVQSGGLLSQWIRTGERPALLATFDPARPSLAAAAP